MVVFMLTVGLITEEEDEGGLPQSVMNIWKWKFPSMSNIEKQIRTAAVSEL